MSSNIKITRICQLCGHEFIAKTTVTKYCGDPCAKRAYKLRIKDQKIIESENETKVIRETSFKPLILSDYLTVKEVAVILKCDPRTIYDIIRSGKLNAVNLSQRKIRIQKDDLNALFSDPVNSAKVRDQSSIRSDKISIKHCYSIGEILTKYKISEITLRKIISKYQIPKHQKGKYVYVSKNMIDPVLKNFILE